MRVGKRWAPAAACGGGLARANGYNTYVDLAAGPDGFVFAAISSSENTPKSKYQVSVLRWNGLSWADLGSKSAADGGISDNGVESVSVHSRPPFRKTNRCLERYEQWQLLNVCAAVERHGLG